MKPSIDPPLTLATFVLFLVRVEATLKSTVTVTIAALTSPLSASYTDSSSLDSSILNSTNFYRYEHSAPFVSWNSTLASYAHDWADRCVFEHSHGPYGENLALGYLDATAAVDAWGDERSLYNFQSPTGFTEATGHFTQLVWKSTTSTGCAAVDCTGKNGLQGAMVVCEYWPPGNIVGDGDKWFKENVGGQANDGQGFNYAQATSGQQEPTGAVATPTSGNMMGQAPIMRNGYGGRMWWASAATIMALILARGMA